jgi:hypothetical protein
VSLWEEGSVEGPVASESGIATRSYVGADDLKMMMRQLRKFSISPSGRPFLLIPGLSTPSFDYHDQDASKVKEDYSCLNSWYFR